MKFIAYIRVSTAKQGASGLGLEAQQAAIKAYMNGGELLAEYVEVESGKRDDRPELNKALKHCKLTGAKLIIARLDRLARNVEFTARLMNSGVKFIACDMPDANDLTIHILAAVAQGEAKAISARTKAALQAAKERGVTLGNPRNLTDAARRKGQPRATQAAIEQADQFASHVGEIVADIAQQGLTLRGIAKELTARGIKTARGGQWTAAAVANVIKRLPKEARQ